MTQEEQEKRNLELYSKYESFTDEQKEILNDIVIYYEWHDNDYYIPFSKTFESIKEALIIKLKHYIDEIENNKENGKSNISSKNSLIDFLEPNKLFNTIKTAFMCYNILNDLETHSKDLFIDPKTKVKDLLIPGFFNDNAYIEKFMVGTEKEVLDYYNKKMKTKFYKDTEYKTIEKIIEDGDCDRMAIKIKNGYVKLYI